MTFTEITITTNQGGLEVLTGMLSALGVTGLTVVDPSDFEEFLSGTQTHWDYVEDELMEIKNASPSVTFYVGEGESGKALIASVIEGVEGLKKDGLWGQLEITFNTVAEEDWAENWKQYFKPLTVGDKLLIKPSWEEVSEDEGRIILEIDPASSFGTGTHHTTQLCLTAIEAMELEGARVLDMGCGSGILGIAAALLGASQITMVDIDENAVKTAGENALLNGVLPEDMHLFSGDVIQDAELEGYIGHGFDIVLANIVADIIIGMKHQLYRFVSPSGKLLVSGVLDSRADEVSATLCGIGFEEKSRHMQSDWVAMLFKKK